MIWDSTQCRLDFSASAIPWRQGAAEARQLAEAVEIAYISHRSHSIEAFLLFVQCLGWGP